MKNPNPITKTMKTNLITLPTPSPISYSWNMGALLSLNLITQILSGFLLSMHYSPSISTAFIHYMEISRDLNQGFILKFMHSTGASTFFTLIFIHMFRGMTNNSFKNTTTWYSGLTIFIMLMMTAFTGYILPWGQMSFWGATVITNLLSTIPFIGDKLTTWLWGGFSVENPTLNRFFSIHFILPMLISTASLVHLSLLHQTGSSSNINLNVNKDKIPFKNFFSTKDLISSMILISTLTFISTSLNLSILDPTNFSPANPLSTPNHIMPEWYFLFAYTILRSIPNKLGGAMALIASIMILFLLPLTKKSNSSKFNPILKTTNFIKMLTFFMLTFLGAQTIEEPYLLLSKTFSFIYFTIILL